MITVNGKEYDLKFNIARVQLIEKACGAGVMETLVRSNGMMPLQLLLSCVAFGLLGEDGIYIAVKHGMEHAQRMVEEQGYQAVDMMVVDALQRDCPFFFQAG